MRQVVVQLVQHLSPGGIETMALDLQQHLPHCEVHVVSLDGHAEEALDRWPRLQQQPRLHFLGKPEGISLATVFRLVKLLKRIGATALHSHHIGPLLYGGIAARLAGLSSLVHTEHDAWHLEDPRRRRLQRHLLQLLRPQLVADCSAVAERLKHHFPAVPVEIVLNGIDTQQFSPLPEGKSNSLRQQLGLNDGDRLIGCAARLEEVKGHRYLLQALSALPDHNHLVLAGGGSLQQSLQQLAAQLGLAKRVHFLGALDDMPGFYRAIDLFCLPSLNEGLPLSPLEAQACDVPVVITNTGGCADIVCPDSGFLVAPGDANALGGALQLALENRSTAFPRQFACLVGDLRRTAGAYAELLGCGPDDKEFCHV